MNRSLKRFLRGFGAYVAAAGLLYGATFLIDTPVLDSYVGVGMSAVVAGFLLAVGKFIRDKYGVDFSP